jgi:predicted transposase YdaD
MSAKPYDQAFKYLAEQDPESLLILLGCLQPSDKAHIELLQRELSVSTLLPDQPYLVRTRGEEWIAHVEAQTIYDPLIPHRMAEYGARLWMTYRLPVRSYVLLLTSGNLPRRAPSSGRIEAGDIEIRANYHLVKLWQHSAAGALATKRENLLPFVPLMRGGEAEVEEAAARLRGVVNEQRQRDLSLHFIVLGGLRYNREEIVEMVVRRGMIPLEQLKASSMYEYFMEEGLEEGRKQGLEQGLQQGLEQGIQKGRKEGRKKGLQEGRKEGRKEGEAKGIAEAILLFISERFPQVDVSEQIKRIKDPARLRKLYTEIIKMSDAAELKKLLSRIPKSSRR